MIRGLRRIARRSPAARWLLRPVLSSYGRIWDLAALSSNGARWWMDGAKSEEELDATGRRDAALIAAVLPPDARVLDLGCGIGRVLQHLAPHCAELHGVDVSERMLAHARARLRGISNLHLHRTGGRDLRMLPDASFDFAFAFQLFHHLEREDAMRYLAELRRVLTPGGGIQIQFLNFEVEELAREFRDYALESVLLQPARRRYTTEQEVRVLGRLAGFDDVQVRAEDEWLYLTGRRPVALDAPVTSGEEARR